MWSSAESSPESSIALNDVSESRKSVRVRFEYSEASTSYRTLPPHESAAADSDSDTLPDAAKLPGEDGLFAGKLVAVPSWMQNTPDRRALRGTAKTRLANGDVYPQEPKQDEDNLGSEKLKKGFTTGPCDYEHKTVNGEIDRDDAHYRAAQFYMQVVQKKAEVKQESKKSKDSVSQLPVASPMKAKDRVLWYQNLAKGKALVALMQKPPTFKTKEHMFNYLYDFRITPSRAIWNLKLAANIANNANHKAKSKTFSGEIFAVEYAHEISRAIRQVFWALFELESLDECDETSDKWWYFSRLSKTAFDEGVIDRQEFINELCDIFTDIFLRRVTGQEDTEYQLNLWMQYFHYFVPSATQNLVLARRVAVMMCQKLSLMKEEFEEEEAELLTEIREGRYDYSQRRGDESGTGTPSNPPSQSESGGEMEGTDPPPPPQLKEPLISVKAPEKPNTPAAKDGDKDVKKEEGDGAAKKKTSTEQVMGKVIKEEPLDEDEVAKEKEKSADKEPVGAAGNKKETRRIHYDPEHPDKFTFDVMFAVPELRQPLNSLVALLFTCIGEQPGAMVYNKFFVDMDRQPYMLTQLGGSPLDYLPCPLLDLPYEIGNEQANSNIRDLMEAHEHDIILRSELVQNQWVPTFHTQRQHAKLIAGCVDVVGFLDSFDILKKGAVETVYKKIFTGLKYSRYAHEICARVRLCLTWAITVQRDGQWRSWLVARVLKMLLHKRPHREKYGYFGGTHINLILIDFINHDLPKPGDENYYKEFKNFCMLFFEFARFEVFTHADLYAMYTSFMKTYCRRMELDPNEPIMNAFPPVNADEEQKDGAKRKEGETSVGSEDASRQEEHDALKMEIDGDESVVEMKMASGDGKEASKNNLRVEKQLVPLITLPEEPADGYRLLDEDIPPLEQLVIQLPISSGEQLFNKRNQMMFGNTQNRNKHIEAAKRVTAEFTKILRKKMYIKWLRGKEDVKFTRRVTAPQLNELLQKMREHTLFDRQLICNWVADIFTNSIRWFIDSESLQMPTFEAFDLVCSLYEQTNNMHGLFEFCLKLIPQLPAIERVIRDFKSVIIPGLVLSQYTYVICSYLVKHLHYFIHYEQAIKVVNKLYSVMEKSLKAQDYPRNGFGRAASACIFHLREQLIKSEIAECEDMLGGMEEFEHIFNQGETASTGQKEYHKLFMMDNLQNQILRIYTYHDFKKRLPSFDKAVNRYSFVVNAFVAASKLERDFDKLSELASFCSHWTAHHPEMANDWMGAIKALCMARTTHASFGFQDLLREVDVSDCSLHYPLSTFAVLLASKYCYSVPKMISELNNYVFSPVMKKESGRVKGGGNYKNDNDSEPNVCLALLYLAQISCGSDDPFILSEHYRGRHPVKKTVEWGCCHLNILSMIHWCELNKVVFPMIASIGIMNDTLQTKIRDHDNRLEVPDGTLSEKRKYESYFLPLIVRQVLISICEQDWVKDRMYKIAEADDMSAFNQDRLKQNCLGQQLLRLGTRRRCEREILAQLSVCNGNSKKALIDKLFSVLNIWNFRATLLDLRLMIKEISPESSKHAQQGGIAAEALMVEIAKCCRELFVQAYKSNKIILKANERFSFSSLSNYMVIPTLINQCPTPSNMPSSISGASFKSKFLSEVCNMLEVGSDPNTDKLKMSAWLMMDRSFLNIIMACMKGSPRDDQTAKDTFTSSILKQIQDLAKIKENHLYHYHTAHGEERKGIFLRIQLVAYIFDEVCRANIVDGWAHLFFQLMLHGVVTPLRNLRMYNMVFDMLSSTIMWSLTDDSTSAVVPFGEKSNGQDVKYRFPSYMGIVKRLRKELHDARTMMETKNLHAFLPLPKNIQQMLAFEPFGTQPTNSIKSLRLSQQANIGLRRGRPCLQIKKVGPEGKSSREKPDNKTLQSTDRIRITAFEMLQGYNPNPEQVGKKFPALSFYMANRLDMSMTHPYRVIQRLMGHAHPMNGCVTNPLQLDKDEVTDIFLDPVAMDDVGERPWMKKKREKEAREKAEAERRMEERNRAEVEKEKEPEEEANRDEPMDTQTNDAVDKEREASVATPAALAGPEIVKPHSNDGKKEMKEEEVVVLDSPLKGLPGPMPTPMPMKEQSELAKVMSQPLQATAMTAHFPPSAIAAMGGVGVGGPAPQAPSKVSRRRSTAKEGGPEKKKKPTKRNAAGLTLQTTANPPLMATPPKGMMPMMHPGHPGQMPPQGMGMQPPHPGHLQHPHHQLPQQPGPSSEWAAQQQHMQQQSQPSMQQDQFAPPHPQQTQGPATTLSQLMGHHQPGQPLPPKQQQPSHLQQQLHMQQQQATASAAAQPQQQQPPQHPGMSQQQMMMQHQQQQQMQQQQQQQQGQQQGAENNEANMKVKLHDFISNRQETKAAQSGMPTEYISPSKNPVPVQKRPDAPHMGMGGGPMPQQQPQPTQPQPPQQQPQGMMPPTAPQMGQPGMMQPNQLQTHKATNERLAQHVKSHQQQRGAPAQPQGMMPQQPQPGGSTQQPAMQQPPQFSQPFPQGAQQQQQPQQPHPQQPDMMRDPALAQQQQQQQRMPANAGGQPPMTQMMEQKRMMQQQQLQAQHMQQQQLHLQQQQMQQQRAQQAQQQQRPMMGQQPGQPPFTGIAPPDASRDPQMGQPQPRLSGGPRPGPAAAGMAPGMAPPPGAGFAPGPSSSKAQQQPQPSAAGYPPGPSQQQHMQMQQQQQYDSNYGPPPAKVPAMGSGLEPYPNRPGAPAHNQSTNQPPQMGQPAPGQQMGYGAYPGQAGQPQMTSEQIKQIKGMMTGPGQQPPQGTAAQMQQQQQQMMSQQQRMQHSQQFQQAQQALPDLARPGQPRPTPQQQQQMYNQGQYQQQFPPQ